MENKASPFTGKMSDLNHSWEVTVMALCNINIRRGFSFTLEKEKQELT